jgi:2-polyprenyl-3-methyl-5-hydroxy-6-metoxy-1,4-benzoquinol methylase
MADQGAEGLLSPYLRKKRMQAALPYLKGRVLDIGCGSGMLATWIAPERYLGVDIDASSLAIARARFPAHHFTSESPAPGRKFDTVVALAVIEHVVNPAGFLRRLATYLDDAADSRIVVSTPHPSLDWIHDAGSTIGLFSRHANEQHEALLGRAELEDAGRQAGLRLLTYSRFLFGANQLAVYARHGR